MTAAAAATTGQRAHCPDLGQSQMRRHPSRDRRLCGGAVCSDLPSMGPHPGSWRQHDPARSLISLRLAWAYVRATDRRSGNRAHCNEIDGVLRLVADAEAVDQMQALNEAALLRLRRAHPTTQHLLVGEDDELVGYAQLGVGDRVERRPARGLS